MTRFARLALALSLATVSAASAPAPAPAPSPARWLMGYLVGYERALAPLDTVPWASMTHVVVGRARPLADGTVTTDFDIDDVAGPAWARSVVARARRQGVKTVLMLGGAGERDGFVGAASPARRAAFVGRLLDVVRDYGFDGIDLDWEPLRPEDEAPLKALATALRAARPNLILTLPVAYVNANFPRAEARPSLAGLAPLFDRVNIMTYAMAGTYEGWHAWHGSALRGEGENTPTSVAASVDAYLAAGIPARKLGVGIGAFGLCYTGVTGPRQTAAARIVAADGEMSFANIMKSYAPKAARRFDEAAGVPYLSSSAPLGPKGCTYVSYEDARSVALKGAYAKSRGLGGAIVWTVGQGPDLLRAAWTALR